MSRRQRQLDELHALCRAGDVARAVDLAFAHVADFGPDSRLLETLAEAVDRSSVPPRVRRRFEELCAHPS